MVDSSVAACWALPDETSGTADDALDAIVEEGMIVPTLFAYEIRNVLLVNERRGRIEADDAETVIRWIEDFGFETDADFHHETLGRLARGHQLTIYDAAYLELALRTGSALATLDKRLKRAAETEGIRCL